MNTERLNPKNGERGMIAILMAIALVALIGAGSLAVDIGSALVTKSELQNVADASSLAATRELAMIYKGLSPKIDYKTYTLNGTEILQIKSKALAFAAANKAGGLSITVGESDVVRGTYNLANGTLSPTDTGVRAIQVIARRDDTNNGQVQTTLGRVLGINSIAITASSAAAISAVGTGGKGFGEFPIGLDEDWFDSHTCASTDIIQFSPTSPKSCAGWHTFNKKPASESKLEEIIDGIQDGSFKSPVTIANETRYEFTGGVKAALFPDLIALFDSKKNGTGTWTVNAPVYESSGCDNPNQDRLIIGFAKVKIQTIEGPPSKLVEGTVECGVFDNDELGEGGEGGGPSDFGVLVGNPSMIQ